MEILFLLFDLRLQLLNFRLILLLQLLLLLLWLLLIIRVAISAIADLFNVCWLNSLGLIIGVFCIVIVLVACVITKALFFVVLTYFFCFLYRNFCTFKLL